MNAAGSAQGDDIELLGFEHFFEILIGWHLVFVRVFGKRRRVDIANGRQLELVGVLFDRAEVVARNAAATDDGDAYLASGDRGVMQHAVPFAWGITDGRR